MACQECGFALFNPVRELSVSEVGVYNDTRFYGRSIVLLNNHYESLENIPEEEYISFFADVRAMVVVLKKVTKSQRINVSVLGNTEAHVHAHLIPRYPEKESLPGKSPWNDPRPHSVLNDGDLSDLQQKLLIGLIDTGIKQRNVSCL